MTAGEGREIAGYYRMDALFAVASRRWEAGAGDEPIKGVSRDNRCRYGLAWCILEAVLDFSETCRPMSGRRPASSGSMSKVWFFLGGFLGLLAGIALTVLVMSAHDWLTQPSEDDVAAPLRSYLDAAALGDDDEAYAQLYQGPGQQGPIYRRKISSTPDLYFGYSELEISHSFNDKDDGFIQGVMSYRNGSSRPVSAIVRRGESGWGLYNLWFE